MPPYEIVVDNCNRHYYSFIHIYFDAKRAQHFPHNLETGEAELVEIFTENDTITLTFEDSVEVRELKQKGGAIE